MKYSIGYKRFKIYTNTDRTKHRLLWLRLCYKHGGKAYIGVGYEFLTP